MALIYNKWTDKEKSLLKGFVISRINKGVRINTACKEFAELYSLTTDSVTNQWQHIAAGDKESVAYAKYYYKTFVKPEEIALLKEAKKKEREQLRAAKETAKLREKWRKAKLRKLAKEAREGKMKRTFRSGMRVSPADKRLTISIDERGIVTKVKEAK